MLSCHEESQQYDVFRYNQVNVINSLDPAFAKSLNNIWAVNHIFNTLVKLDDDLNIIPSLSDHWTISEDGLEYKFHIRPGILFHEDLCFGEQKTRVLEAKDLVYSFNRIIDEKVSSPGSWIFKGRVAETEPFKAISIDTFTITLKSPFRPFLGILAMKYCSAVPHEAVEYYGSKFREKPIGTGPLKLKRWIENQGLYLVRNDNYFDGPIEYDGVKTSFINDKKIAFLEMLNGNLDFNSGLESAFINELLTKEGELQEKHLNNIKYYKAPYLNTEYIGVNQNNPKIPILKNKAFRQALNFAIDRNQLLRILRNNVGKAAEAGFIPKGLPSYDPEKVNGYVYNVEKAKELLELSEYHKTNEVITLSTNNDYLDIITFVARQWELLGIQVKIEVLESSLLRAGMKNGEIDLFRASWIADYPDGENFLSLFYSKNPAPPNYTRFGNREFDQLYEQSLLENRDSERYDLYHQMDRILIEEAPVILLFYDETALFYNARIDSASANGINLLNVETLKIN